MTGLETYSGLFRVLPETPQVLLPRVATIHALGLLRRSLFGDVTSCDYDIIRERRVRSLVACARAFQSVADASPSSQRSRRVMATVNDGSADDRD